MRPTIKLTRAACRNTVLSSSARFARRREAHREPAPADVATAVEILRSLPEREREALTCFYLEGKEPHEIHRHFGLSDSEWNQIKRRARTLFEERRSRPAL